MAKADIPKSISVRSAPNRIAILTASVSVLGLIKRKTSRALRVADKLLYRRYVVFCNYVYIILIKGGLGSYFLLLPSSAAVRYRIG